MQSLPDIKALLDLHGLSPNKSLGQNFLIEPAHVARLVDASGVNRGDLVLEIGPGTGVLTDVLLERGCEVVACELDRGLADLLRERYAGRKDFTLIEGDCLASKEEINPGIVRTLSGRPFRLVANLPYGAASPLMIALATRFHPTISGATTRPASGKPWLRAVANDGTASPVDQAVTPTTLPTTRLAGEDAGQAVAPGAACLGQFVTIQREVADRLRAQPGTRDYGEMGVLVQAMCEVKRIAVLPPGCFWPPPKVESEMVAITPRPDPLTNDPARLAALCRVLFTQRRKQIGGVLAKAAPHMLRALPRGVEPTMRAEQLAIEQLIALSALM